MRPRHCVALLFLVFFTSSLLAQLAELSRAVKEFVRVSGPKIILTHVRVIDGTGSPATDDQNVVIESGKIAAL